jgi:hypothetical protein
LQQLKWMKSDYLPDPQIKILNDQNMNDKFWVFTIVHKSKTVLLILKQTNSCMDIRFGLLMGKDTKFLHANQVEYM